MSKRDYTLMELKPLMKFSKTKNKLYTLVDRNSKYLVKCYCGPHNLERYTQEKLMINHWKEAGFKVPEIYDKEVQGVTKPYLVTGFIEGMSLREYLSENNNSIDKKLETLTKLFYELSKRHELAIRTDDRYLVHYDPSSGNIICTKNGFYFIDFETPPPKKRSLLESASIEVATTCRWIVRDLGIEFIEEVLKLIVASYTSQKSLLKLIVARTTNRPFQFYHRWQNYKRKLAHPKNVTKYDIVDMLSKLLQV